MYTYTVCVCKLSCQCYKPEKNNSYAPPIVCSLCTQRNFFKLHRSIVILWGGSRSTIYQPYLYNCTIKTNTLRHIVYPPTK